MRVHWLQHVEWEDLGSLQDWLSDAGCQLTCTRLFDDHPPSFPDPDDIDWLIVMGGPMNIYDEGRYPWLVDEKRFIKRVMKTGVLGEKRRVLGICLGAQLIADVLGMRVYPAQQAEVGWGAVEHTAVGLAHPVFNGVDAGTEMFHWHSDCFGTPESAVAVASTDRCDQAFVWDDRIVGLQFHIETTPENAAKLCDNDVATPTAAGVTRQAILGDDGKYARLQQYMAVLMGNLQALELVGS